MQTQLTMSSFSSSVYGCYRYPHHHLHVVPRIPAAKSSSVAAKRNLVLSQSGKNSFYICEAEVVNEGMDCLPNPRTPWLKLCPELGTKEGVVMDAFYSVAEKRVVRLNRRTCLGVPATAKCFASAGEWLGFINPIDDLEMYLVNPFFSNKDMGVIRLPCLTSIPSCVGVERDPETGNVTVKLADYADFVRESVTPQVAASYITNLAISHSDPRHVECVVAALQGKGIRRLSYSRIWDDDKRWIGLQEGCPPFNSHKQLVFSRSRKLFYTINNNGIEAYDLLRKQKKGIMWVFPNEIIKEELQKEFELEQNEELKRLREVSSTGEYKYYRRYHLVLLDEPEPEPEPGESSSSQLLLIVRHLVDIEKSEVLTKHFDVFKVIFDTRRHRLVRMKSLGDYCLFVSRNNCFSLRASRVPGLHPNSIYFTHTHPLESSKPWNFQRGIFYMDNNEFVRKSWDYIPLVPNFGGKCTPYEEMWMFEHEFLWVSPSNIIT